MVSFWEAGLELAGGAVNVSDGLSEGGQLLVLLLKRLELVLLLPPILLDRDLLRLLRRRRRRRRLRLNSRALGDLDPVLADEGLVDVVLEHGLVRAELGARGSREGALVLVAEELRVPQAGVDGVVVDETVPAVVTRPRREVLVVVVHREGEGERGTGTTGCTAPEFLAVRPLKHSNPPTQGIALESIAKGPSLSFARAF